MFRNWVYKINHVLRHETFDLRKYMADGKLRSFADLGKDQVIPAKRCTIVHVPVGMTGISSQMVCLWYIPYNKNFPHLT